MAKVRDHSQFWEYETKEEAFHEMMIRVQKINALLVRIQSYTDNIHDILTHNNFVEFTGDMPYGKIFHDKLEELNKDR